LGKILRRVLLAVVIVIAAGIGIYFFLQTSALEGEWSDKVAVAEAELKDAETARDSLDPETETGAAAWESWKSNALQAGQNKLQEIQNENSALDASVQESEASLQEKLADEEIAYYMAIYDSMAEGMEKVEGYIEQGN